MKKLEKTIEQNKKLRRRLRLKSEKIEELMLQLSNSNAIVAKQIEFINKLNAQLDIQDKAITRKDNQYEALKKLYKDDLINGQLG